VIVWILSAALAGAALLVLCAVMKRFFSPAPGCRVLGSAEMRFLEAVSETVFPPYGTVPKSGREAGIPAYMDRYLHSLPSRFRFLIRLLFLLFENAPVLFSGRPRRFSSLSSERRKRYLEGWESSRWYARRMSAQGLKTLLCIGYMADPAVKEAIGFRKKETCSRSADPLPAPDRPNARNVEGIVQYRDLSRHTVRETADFCIVGSGAAGAVLAHELSSAGKKVVILEEGSYWTGSEVPEDPAYALRLLFREAGFRTCRGRTFVPTMQASCVGGTTFVNSSICFRFPERILKEWAAESGIEHLTPEALAPCYERVERIAGIRPVDPDVLGVKNRLFQKGTEALGIHGQVFSRAERDCHGCSECMPACPTGAKQSMERSYLPRAVKQGARIYADCRAEEILARGGQVFGVRGVFREPGTGKPGGTILVNAKAVILSAGVMDSPVILLKNRIGNSSGWVGRNLVHHPGSAMFGVFREVVNPWEGATQGFGSGEYLERDIKLEVIWGPPAYLAVRLPGFGQELQGHLARYRHTVAWDSMVRGASRGRVEAGAGWNPRISYSVLQRDVDRIVEGLRIVAEMFFAAGAHTVLPGIHGLPQEARSMQDLDGLRPGRIRAEQIVIVSNHAFGTCRMGADPNRSVVDPFCESYDIKDLYVCDSSVFPSGTGVNPMEPIMVVADLTAQTLKQRY
jgi:choline dehydrogenase-like flavoprotein